MLIEQEVALTEDWNATGWFDADAWCRVKMDFVVLPDGDDRTLRVIDLKTGKMKPEHRDQVELYALGGFCAAWPSFKDDAPPSSIMVELWYSDQGQIIDAEYVLSEVSGLKKLWVKRTRKMLSDTKFIAKPGGYCGYCDFAAKKDGPCRFGA